MAKNSLLQRVIHRLATSDAELESEEMQRAVEAESAVPIRTCEDRQLVRLRGTVSNVTIHPRGGHPALEVELRDGSGSRLALPMDGFDDVVEAIRTRHRGLEVKQI
jgi:hypothetical protein